MHLINIPYAGGNKHSYRQLKPFLDKSISITTLELPGRGSRTKESLTNNLQLLAEDIYQQVKNLHLSNYMLYGHSMGAMLGDLLLHKLKDNNEKLPFHFLITGCPSPIRKGLRPKLSELNDQEFQMALNSLGGLPDEVLKTPELLNYIMPVLRNDLKAIDTDVYKNTGKYAVPLTIFAGTEEGLQEKDITTWQLETSIAINYKFLKGGHFFINKNLNFMGNFINNIFLKQIEKTTVNRTKSVYLPYRNKF